jgi:hypothetical protein
MDTTMCVLLKYIFFDFASDETLKYPANPARFFDSLVADGEFHLSTELDAPIDQQWNNVVRMRPKNAYLAFENAGGLTITFGVYPNEWRRWYAMVYGGVISTPTSHVHIRSLVKASELVYTTMKPDYGYGLIALETQLVSGPGEDELAALYDYNFLSPRLVEKLGGKAKAISAPAARTVEFDDGGLLLEMSAHPITERKAATANYIEAAQRLGIGKYIQGGA